MAERRAQNKYFPIDWNPKHGSVNKYQGQHPLRDRARKLKEGIMIIRFEMPYNVVCEKCNDYIARGVRFNAQKKCIGKYFNTKIWSFRMKCATCSHWFEVQTDPQARDYKMVEGCRRNLQGSNDEKNFFHDDDDEHGDHLLVDPKQEKIEHTAEKGTVAIMSDEQTAAIRTDPFKRLEHLRDDKEFGDVGKIHLTDLHDLKERLSKDDYQMNSILRKQFREQKKVLKSLHDEGINKGTVPLLPYNKEDDELALELMKSVAPSTSTTTTSSASSASSSSSTSTSTPTTVVRLDTKKTKQAIMSSSIFGSTTATPQTSSAVQQQAIKKCIARGIDPKIFRKGATGQASSNSKISTFSMKSPAPVNLKKRN